MIKRNLWDKIIPHLDEPEAIVITGPRRVGKTTTLQYLLDQIESQNKLFLDLENLGQRQIFEKIDYDDVISELKARGLDLTQKIYLAVDEIQFLPQITSIIKYLGDHYNIKFILTGSSSYYLKNHFTESLAGRKQIFELLPLTFGEFLRFKGAPYTPSQIDIYCPPSSINQGDFIALNDYYQEYVSFGGFPAVALADETERKKEILYEIYSAYINQDVQTLSDIKSLTDLRQIITLLASRVGNRLNINELSTVSGLARETIQNYLEFLEQTYLIRLLEVESTSPDVRLRKSCKLYFVDTGIARINADLSSGQKFENTVATQLWHYHQQITYFEDKNGEIDFIVRTPPLADIVRVIAYEAKQTPTNADLTTLKRRAQRIGIGDAALIGLQKTEKFQEYIWGGSL